MPAEDCTYCSERIPRSWSTCPHCGQPGLFPNVRDAEEDIQKSALQSRYDSVRDFASHRDTLAEFEIAVATTSAVVNRDFVEALRLLSSAREMYASHYELLNVVRLPEGSEWDILRQITDAIIFPGYFREIHFATLSYDGKGLPHYGNCCLRFAEDMIAHRATVFEQNSVVWMEESGIMLNEAACPAGYRATWDDRAMLAVSKLGMTVDLTTTSEDYGRILVMPGDTPRDDKFIEVHIYGSITGKTIASVEPQSCPEGEDEEVWQAVLVLLEHFSSSDYRAAT